MNFITKKVKLLLFLLCLVVMISTVNTTYSRYVSESTGTITTELARWQIFVNNKNITEQYNTNITFTPIIEENVNIASNKIAPTSKGYFDIVVDPTNVDVSFSYNISLTVPDDSLITDIKITDYTLIEGTEITDQTSLEKIPLTEPSITDILYYDNKTTDFSFKPFIIRVYFSWIDDESNTMNDEADGIAADKITSGQEEFVLNASIKFKQYTGEEDNTDEEENEVPSEGTE